MKETKKKWEKQLIILISDEEIKSGCTLGGAEGIPAPFCTNMGATSPAVYLAF